MSTGNEEIVRRYMEEVRGVDGVTHDPGLMRRRLAAYWDSNGDYYPVRKFPEARPCHSLEEIVAFFGDFLGAWKNYAFEMLELRAIDDQRVFAYGEMSAQGRESGMDLKGDVYGCFWMRNGKFFRVEDHLTREGALAALGLPASPGNEEVYRRTLAAFDQGDRETWLGARAEDCKVIPSAIWPEADTIHGREAAWDFYDGVVRSFAPRAWADGIEIVASGAEKLVVHQHDDIRGAASGAGVELDYWVVVTFHDGRIVSDEWFVEGAQALSAAGIASDR